MPDKVTINYFELMEQIWLIEGVKCCIPKEKLTQEILDRKYYPYPYETPMSGNCTVDDFKRTRLSEALNNYAH